MPSYADAAGLGQVTQYLASVEEACRPGSRVQSMYRSDMAKIVGDGHDEALLQGYDAGGSMTAALKASSLDHRPGSGPPRVPHGRSSRLITGRVLSWTQQAGAMVLTITYPGLDFVRYLIAGTKHMAARPIGLSPASVERARQRTIRLAADIVKGGRS